MNELTLKKFLGQLQNVELSEYQKKLAEALLNYRTMHHFGGRRSGRTTVVDEVNKYLDKFFPGVGEREI